LKKLFKVGLLVTVLGVLSAPGTAPATPIYTFIGDCSIAGSNCYGSTYSLIIDDANDAINSTYAAALTIGTTGYSGPGAYIDAVDIKVVNSLINNTFHS
jgi:hypothetical protein